MGSSTGLLQQIEAGFVREGIPGSSMNRGLFVIPQNRLRSAVILSPRWPPMDIWPDCDVTVLPATGFTVMDVEVEGICFSWIVIGMGSFAPVEAVLRIARTPACRVLFLGEAGGLVPSMALGEITVPTSVLCGDGASRALVEGSWLSAPCMFEEHPTRVLEARVSGAVAHSQGWVQHPKAFTTDALLAEFMHLDEFRGLGCQVIDMEYGAFTRAANLTGIENVGLLQISDNPTLGVSYLAGRTPEDFLFMVERRQEIAGPALLAFAAG